MYFECYISISVLFRNLAITVPGCRMANGPEEINNGKEKNGKIFHGC